MDLCPAEKVNRLFALQEFGNICCPIENSFRRGFRENWGVFFTQLLNNCRDYEDPERNTSTLHILRLTKPALHFVMEFLFILISAQGLVLTHAVVQ